MYGWPNSIAVGFIEPIIAAPAHSGFLNVKNEGDGSYDLRVTGGAVVGATLVRCPDFRIDKNIPIPDRRSTATGLAKGLIVEMKKMEVGDSIFVPHGRGGDRAIQNVVGHVATATGWKFTRRVVEGGARVWRVR